MNLYITLPKSNLSIFEWFNKHHVSTEVCVKPEIIDRVCEYIILDSGIKTSKQ